MVGADGYPPHRALHAGRGMTEIIDPQHFKGKISVRLGPVALAFAGRVEIDSIETNWVTARASRRRAAMPKAAAPPTPRRRFISSPRRGRAGHDSHRSVLSGAVAQYGRGVGMIQATAAQIIGQFAGNLRKQLAQQPPAPKATAPAAPSTEPAPSQPASPQSAAAQPALPPAASAQAAPPPPTAKPISGFSLIARVIWQQILSLFSGRRP